MPLPKRRSHSTYQQLSTVLVLTTTMLQPTTTAARRMCTSFIMPHTRWRTTIAPLSSFPRSSIPPPPPSPRSPRLEPLQATPTPNSDDDDSQQQQQPTTPTRDQLIEETRAKLAKVQQKKELMVNARKAKMKRHKRKKEQDQQDLTDEERAAKKTQEERINAWIEEVYALDTDLTQELPPRLRIAIDLSYDSTASLYSSLARQLGCAYGLMRKGPHPNLIPSLHLTCLEGEVKEALSKNGGDVWKVHRHKEPVFEVFPPSSSSSFASGDGHGNDMEEESSPIKNDRLIYLTPDSPHVLEARIDPTKVYVIGGLVDRIVLKGRSLGRARSHGVETRRLPLKEFFQACGPKGEKHMSNMALAVDRVIEILMRQYENNGGDWHDSLSRVFPNAVGGEEETKKGDKEEENK